MNEKEKMLNGELYLAEVPELTQERTQCKMLCWEYNNLAPIEIEKRKEIIKNLIFFFLYLLFLIIIIKIPFIYIRDMVNNLFNALFTTELSYTIWNVFIEILYAITTILIFIRIIKKKALELEKNV